MIISSKDNPLIKRTASLSEKKFRILYGEFIVESVKAVKECIAAGMNITSVICAEKYQEIFPNAQIVTESVYSKISTEKTPQGVLATVEIPSSAVIPPKGDCLLLDRLQDPGNVGAIIRTANAAGYEDIYLLDCADAYSPKAVRASMGGLFYVRLHEGTAEEILSSLNGVDLLCADMAGEDVFAYKPRNKFCLCIGNEGAGLSDELRARAVATVKIPMRVSCESLNAAVSASIAMYALKNNNVGE